MIVGPWSVVTAPWGMVAAYVPGPATSRYRNTKHEVKPLVLPLEIDRVLPPTGAATTLLCTHNSVTRGGER